MFSTNRPKTRLFSLLRFPVYADRSALILLVIFLLFGAGDGPRGIILAFAFAAIAFLSIIAHEIGHAIAVRVLKYGESQIVLSGFGGVTMWRGNPNRRDRILIALAGPAVSLLLGLGTLAITAVVGMPPRDAWLARNLVVAFLYINIVWAIFNLLPIHPMDGGQVARAALEYWVPAKRALKLSLIASAVCGVAVLIAALAWGWLFAAIIVAFILLQNWNEWQARVAGRG